MLTDRQPVALQTVAMLFVDGWGKYQYLLNPRKKEIEIVKECNIRAREKPERTDG